MRACGLVWASTARRATTAATCWPKPGRRCCSNGWSDPIRERWAHKKRLEIATLGGASVLGRPDIGALAPGMAADLIGYRLETLDFTGALHDPLAALVFCTPPRVDLSVVNGRVRVKDQQIVDLDLGALVRRHNAISRQMLRNE